MLHSSVLLAHAKHPWLFLLSLKLMGANSETKTCVKCFKQDCAYSANIGILGIGMSCCRCLIATLWPAVPFRQRLMYRGYFQSRSRIQAKKKLYLRRPFLPPQLPLWGPAIFQWGVWRVLLPQESGVDSTEESERGGSSGNPRGTSCHIWCAYLWQGQNERSHDWLLVKIRCKKK